MLRTVKAALSSTVLAGLRWLPPRIAANVKSGLNPLITLDYQRAVILMHADSRVDLLRSQAALKEPETVAWIERCIKPSDVLYDVGANVGAYSLIAAKQFPGRVRVYAFEPSFATYFQLCRNIILNHCEGDVVPQPIALGKEAAVSTFNYAWLEAGMSMHSLGAPLDDKGKPFAPAYRQQVVALSLDELVFRFGLPSPSHMKLDVDGTEFDILCGGMRVLDDVRLRSILIEVDEARGNAEEILMLLTRKGFRRTSEAPHPGTIANWIFERPES